MDVIILKYFIVHTHNIVYILPLFKIFENEMLFQSFQIICGKDGYNSVDKTFFNIYNIQNFLIHI